MTSRKLSGDRYDTATYILALMALVWIPVGWYLFEIRGVVEDMFDYPLTPDGGRPFNVYHEGVILLLSGLGVLIGIIGIRKTRKWTTGLFINAIVFIVVLAFSL